MEMEAERRPPTAAMPRTAPALTRVRAACAPKRQAKVPKASAAQASLKAEAERTRFRAAARPPTLATARQTPAMQRAEQAAPAEQAALSARAR
jgi:hypothetical protein